MKTALLHYWLTNLRGGEKVLSALAELLPGADIFTHAYRPEAFGEPSHGRLWGHPVRESFIAHLPFGRRRPQAYLPLMPAASRRLDLAGYDFILSSESGPVKGICKPKGARHVCYCHTPMRYLWDMYGDYYAAAGIGGKLAMRLWTGRLRREDLKSAESVDEFVANSRFVAERIKRIYGRESTVVHPPVDTDFFHGEFEKGDYYLLAGELVAYKRPELALSACAKLGRKLVVLGRGRLCARLAKAYGGTSTVAFLGRVDDATLRNVYGRARALLFPGIEDFGIVPVEAQAAGTPVVAFRGGGALETVIEGESGLFFPEPTADSLCAAIEEFEGRTWSSDACRRSAARFGKSRFMAEMRSALGPPVCH